VSYAPKLAAALSGATIRQFAYWRRPGLDGQAVLTPEYSATRPIDYSFRDVIALRTCVRLRQEASLQKGKFRPCWSRGSMSRSILVSAVASRS
jgi:hypothetical protein